LIVWSKDCGYQVEPDPVGDAGARRMTGNPHFETAPSWQAAQALLTLRAAEPMHTAGHRLQSLRVHVRGHKKRELPVGDRTLEAHYGSFVLSEPRKGVEEARRLALDMRHGLAARETQIAGRAAQAAGPRDSTH
jgi:hypothetical protein